MKAQQLLRTMDNLDSRLGQTSRLLNIDGPGDAVGDVESEIKAFQNTKAMLDKQIDEARGLAQQADEMIKAGHPEKDK